MAKPLGLLILLAVVLLLPLLALSGGALATGTAASSPYPPLSGSITGPSTLGEKLKATYTIQATGGPAEALNTTIVGVYTYNATLSGANTSSAFVTPASGVLLNGSASVTVSAPSQAQSMTLFVLVRSGYNGANVSDNLTYAIDVVAPFNVTATLVVGSGTSVGPMTLAVTLDGDPVGTVAVPTLTGGSTYPINFQYVPLGLSPGWHTFAISLVPEHGLVTFPGGAETYAQSFYVTGPSPDYTPWYLAGFGAFIGTIFIWTSRVGARRRGRAKK
jgi:hypothetical protein